MKPTALTPDRATHFDLREAASTPTRLRTGLPGRRSPPRPQQAGPAALQPRAESGCDSEELHSLVHRARLGDSEAFSALWSQHEPRIRALFRRRVSADQADDLAQEVAVSALRSMGSLARAGSFASWLSAIARNRLHDALSRAPQPLHWRPLQEAADLEAPATGTPLDAAEILAQVHNLPDCHVEPLLLKLVHGLSGPEIGARVGMTPGSVRVNLCRGMKLLRQRLQAWSP